MAGRRPTILFVLALVAALGASGGVAAALPPSPVPALAAGPAAPVAHPDTLCWERDYSDPSGDAPIDALGYRLSYDCQTRTWHFGVTLSKPLDRTSFDSVAIEIDNDGNASNGCFGFDLLVVGTFPSGKPQGGVLTTPACNTGTWSQVAGATFTASGTALGLDFAQSALGNAARLIWNAGVVPKAQSDPVDDLPDHSYLVAADFLQQTGAKDGYWLVDTAGGVHSYGDALFQGDLAGHHLTAPIVGMARVPTGDGYWLLGRDGGIFTFGHARYFGSTGNIHLNQPVVSMSPTASGNGYWFVAADGGIFSFGDAKFYGSTGARHLNQPIVGMATTKSGKGYWLVAADGGIFSFGDAKFYGSTGARHLNQPIVGMATTKSGKGYWLVAADGGIFSFGDATYYGSTGALRLVSPIVGMTVSPRGKGYRFAAADGGIFSFGDAKFYGGLGGGKPPSPVVGIG